MKRYLFNFIYLFVLIIILKSFIIDAYYVASDSMQKTLLRGDFIIGLKFYYRLKSPSNIPFTNISIPSINLFYFSKPKHNDIIIFKLNEYLINENYTNYEFIKRIVGLPGETIQIKDYKLFINNKEKENYFWIDGTPRKFDKLKIFNPTTNPFSYLNYGPIKIPSKGDSIELNPQNIKFWQPFINFEQGGKFLSTEGTVITLKGIPIRNYKFNYDYYFVVGDNINNSLDSRILGFIPENVIEAKIALIYFSIESEPKQLSFNFIDKIRFSRLLKKLN